MLQTAIYSAAMMNYLHALDAIHKAVQAGDVSDADMSALNVNKARAYKDLIRSRVDSE